MIAPMGTRPDDDMDETLRGLDPAPEPWVARAEELPRIQRAAELLAQRRAIGDETAMADALRDVGLEPDEARMRALARLAGHG